MVRWYGTKKAVPARPGLHELCIPAPRNSRAGFRELVSMPRGRHPSLPFIRELLLLRCTRKSITTFFTPTCALYALYRTVFLLRISGNSAEPVLTFAGLGDYGRLGNQLFQIAATIGIAESQNLRWDFPASISATESGRLFQLSGSLKLTGTRVATIEETSAFHQEIDLRANQQLSETGQTRVLSLHGYYQSLDYFKEHLTTISKFLTIPSAYKKRILDAHPELNLDNCVTLHVRRGDYIGLDHLYNILSVNYYIEALKTMPRVDHVIIVSDDKEWCQKYIEPEIRQPVSYSKFDDYISDFVLLYLGHHIITANSTFSWWAAFLSQLQRIRSSAQATDYNQHGLVVMPRLWFNTTGALADLNDRAIFPDSWTVIDES